MAIITRDEILKDKTEREQLELKAHWALADLSDYFKGIQNPLYYEVNKLIRDLYYIQSRRIS